MEELKCPICENPTRVYMGNARKDRLCAKHADMLKDKKIILNSDGFYVSTETFEILNLEKKLNEQALKCIICGEKTTNNHLFCYSCYCKYRNRELNIKVTECNKFEIMDEAYEGKYKCKDGHIVKSKSEREIDNYLFDHNIPHAYEKAISIDSKEEHDIHPDFFIPNYLDKKEDIYIEHWGRTNDSEYFDSKKYKIKIYEEKKLTVISTNEKDMMDVESSLNRKLQHFEFGKVNFNDEE